MASSLFTPAAGHYGISGDTTTAGGRYIEVREPRLRGDSLTGLSGGTPVAIPLRDVQEIAVKRTDTGRTILLVVGSLAAATVIAGAIVINDLVEED